MRLFGFSDEFYAIDNQIIYPHVFFNSNSSLTRQALEYRKCFLILKNNLNLVILPENDNEFNIIIMKKFRMFLDIIEREAEQAIRSKLSISQFERNVKQALYLRDLGDFKKYWELNKKTFQDWLNMHISFIEGEKFKLVRIALEKYQSITQNLRQDWKASDQKLCHDFYGQLKSNQTQQIITKDVDDRDLQLLSGCLTFVCSYLPYGILYLVTNDKALFTTAKMVTDGKLVFGKQKLRPTGFDTINHIDVLNQYRQYKNAK